MRLIDTISDQLNLVATQGLKRSLKVVEGKCAPKVRVNGEDLTAFCSNDYLGLASDPRVIDALREGAGLYGAGSGASHLVSGHSAAHGRLEARLAAWMAPYVPSARAIYFSTGYMANLALLTALSHQRAETEIFSEALNHASLIDGMKLAGARVKIYDHCGVDSLSSLLQASTAATKIVVTDSVFSMDGNLAPLSALLALCEAHNAWLIIDDAHGFGVLGARGRGTLEHCGLRSENLIYMGTLGKAAGVSGAFVAAHETVIEWIVQRARPYIYTTASPPALAHALMTSLDIIESPEGESRRAHIQALSRCLRAEIPPQLRLMPSATAIQPIIVGENQQAVQLSDRLRARGQWVPAIRPPTVPPGTARLRLTLSAAHSLEQVQTLCQELAIAWDARVCENNNAMTAQLDDAISTEGSHNAHA